MNKLSIDFKNCFGIESLQHEFDFSQENVFSIYARNGLMKTSFAKTFQLLQLGKNDEIRDKIFDYDGKAYVRVDDHSIDGDQIFVVKSYESSYESDISSLLIKGDVQKQLKEVLKVHKQFLKLLEKKSGLKIKKTSQGKAVYELESQIINDFALKNDSILLSLDILESYVPEIQLDDIPYASIFDSTVVKKIRDSKFQKGVINFLSSSEEIYKSFAFLEKGYLTLPKLKDLRKSLEKDAFFVKDNHLYLSGKESVTNISELDQYISEVENKILQLPEYHEIEKLLSDSKGIILKDIIETHPEIIEYLLDDKLDILRKSFWASYIESNKSIFDDLCRKYRSFSDAIDAMPIDDTPWRRALDIFNQRFSVPFFMTVSNLKGAIIGESVPHVEFTFTNGKDTKTMDRKHLEELNTLSQGEKRALYLLNIIFDLEQLKASKKEVLLVVDDIADSFDYKNKYAIIEYLYEMAQENNFYMLILTHNYDFHRTVSSRLGIAREYRLMADVNKSKLILEKELYQNQPFEYWKNKPTEKYILALIPFVRNLIKYGIDKNVSNTGEDFKYLTSLLHEKYDTHSITFADIEPLYKEYMGVKNFDDSVDLTKSVLDNLYSICDDITYADVKLENKIILAIGIRHKAEKFMISEIESYAGQIKWCKHKQSKMKSSSEYLDGVKDSKNQTRELFNGYSQFGDSEKVTVLNEVNIMTPEHIHINSFMYEPILDMDIEELLNLYQRVKSL